MAQARKHKFPLPDSFGVNTLACEPVGMAAPFYDCDTVLIVSPQYFPMSVVDVMRKIGIKVAAYFTEAPYEDTLNAPVQASHFDVVFVNDRNSVGLFKSFCDNTYSLPHGCRAATPRRPCRPGARLWQVAAIPSVEPSASRERPSTNQWCRLLSATS